MLRRLFAILLTAGTVAHAETCATLPAQITLRDGRIDPADETRLDTRRIQDALDRCAPGGTLRLSVQGPSNAFLSGALQMKSGVTLLIDKGAILFASRDARIFQVKQGSCGVVDDKGGGCKPLLSCKNVINAAAAGEGVIDGRSDATILGETYSWRDLAQEARLKNGKLNVPEIFGPQACRSLLLIQVRLRNDGDVLF